MTEYRERDQDGQALRRLSTDARVEARMLDQDKPITDAQRATLLRELTSYKERTKVGGASISWSKLAEGIGVSNSVLTETVRGKYGGDVDGVLRKIDQFLAAEQQRDAEPSIRERQKISVSDVCHAVASEAITCNSMAVITGEHGIGKTVSAKWIQERNAGAVLITCDDKDCDENFVIDALYDALRIGTHTPHRRHKKREIVAHLETHRNVIIIVDECQKLTRAALELLRTIHDQSDGDGRRNTPVILFGDQDFYRLVVQSKGGKRTLLSPQITSRLYPVVSLEAHCFQRDDEGQAIPNSVYTTKDIEQVIKNQRLRIVRPDAIGWITRLANVHHHGRLRLAVRVVEIARRTKTGPTVTVKDLVAALELFLGPDESALVQTELVGQGPSRVAVAG